MQLYKRTFQEFYMRMDVKPKGKLLKRMVWKIAKAKMKSRDRKEFREAILERKGT